MDAADGRPDKPEPRARPTERKGAPRPRDGGAGSTPRPADDTRRKRANERRYVGWGDGVAREFCAAAMHLLPLTFPVASRGGAATIQAVEVARRADAMLLCDFSHDGDHVWPDGEVVEGET